MLLENTAELDKVNHLHFGDPLIRDIVQQLQQRKKSRRPKNGEGLIQLTLLLQECGCDKGIQSVEDAKEAIRQRVEVDGQYVQALAYLGRTCKVTADLCGATSEAKRAFVESVKHGAGKEIQ